MEKEITCEVCHNAPCTCETSTETPEAPAAE